MPKDSSRQGYVRLIAALLGAALLPLNSTMTAVILPEIVTDLHHAPSTVTQAIVTSYLVAAVALQPAGGKLGDRFGHWRIFSAGLVLMGAGAILGSIAPSLVVLALARVLIAAGGAMVVPVTLALIRVEVPESRRGQAFGMFAAVMALAAVIGPVRGGEVASLVGWRSVFGVNLPVIALSVALLRASPRRVPAVTPLAEQPRFNWQGMVLIAVVLIVFMLTLQTHGVVMAILAGDFVLFLLVFVWWEQQAADPIFDFDLFALRSFMAGTLLIALQNLVMYTLLFELPQILHSVLLLDQAVIGRLLILMMATMVITSLVAGRLTDNFGSRLLAVTGSLVCMAGIALLAFTHLTLEQLFLPLVLMGAGLGLVTPAAQSASLKDVRRQQSGIAAGMSSTMRYLGGIVGIAILGRTLNISDDPIEVIGDHRRMLMIFGGALVVGLICAVLLPGRESMKVEKVRVGAARP